MSNAKFELLLSLYRDATFVRGREARLSITTDDLQTNLTKCLADLDEFAVSVINGDPDQVRLGGAYVLEFRTPRIGIGLFLDNFPSLLMDPRNRVIEPRRYFLIDGKFANGDENIPAEVVAYRQALSLVENLRKAAAYLDPDSGTLVFVHEGKFEMPVIYEATDIARMDQEALKKFLAFVGEDTHSEQKLGILEAAIRDLVGNIKNQERFAFLLTHLPELVAKINESYRLFASSFSYEKIRDQLESVKIEYTAKIHKAFTDIQTQILSIPVATIIVASQMKDPTKAGYEYWVNLSILIGCWIFALLVGFSLWNQINTLTVLATEIKRQKEQIQKDYKDIAGRFTDVFEFLDCRLLQQKIALGSVGIVLAIGLVLSHFVYWKLSRTSLAPTSSAPASEATTPTKELRNPNVLPSYPKK